MSRPVVKNSHDVKSGHKFGENPTMAAGDHIWPLSGKMTEKSSGSIYLSSAHAGDISIAVSFIYLDATGNWQLGTAVTNASNGQTGVDTGCEGIWVHRAYLTGDDVTLNGALYLGDEAAPTVGVPAVLGTYAVIPIADNQTMQCVIRVPTGMEYHVEGWSADAVEVAAAVVHRLTLTHKPSGGSWRTIDSGKIDTGNGVAVDKHYKLEKVYPAGTLIAIYAVAASAATSRVNGQIHGHLKVL